MFLQLTSVLTAPASMEAPAEVSTPRMPVTVCLGSGMGSIAQMVRPENNVFADL